jgi:hypothetical protein
MKYKLKATDDINQSYGNLVMNADKGGIVEFSATDAEIALRTGRFEVAEEIPTNDFEKAEANRQAEIDKLLTSNKKDALVSKAKKLNKKAAAKIDTGLNKEPLATAIVEAENTDKNTDKKPTSIINTTTLTEEPIATAIVESAEASADK